jgi:hypothetical protein
VAGEGDPWVTADPRLGHADGEPVMLAKLMESDPPARPKERETVRQKSSAWDEEEMFVKIYCFRSYSMRLSSLTCLIGIGGCKSGLLQTNRMVGALKENTQ